MEKARLKIGIFLDGRPGHEKQTLGIVTALRELVEVESVELRVAKGNFFDQIWETLKYFLGVSGSPLADLNGFHFLLGTGTATHLPMLTHKRIFSLAAITCMAPSSLLRQHFDLCCVPQHDGLIEDKNILSTIGPPNCSVSLGSHDEKSGLILLGGIDRRSHHWDDNMVAEQVNELIAKGKNMSWTISTSPRTPEATIQRIEKHAQCQEHVSFHRYEDTPHGWIEREYNRNKTVWVTADSMSMVYEALSAGCCVGILPVEWKKKNSKFTRSESYLLKNNLVVSYSDFVQEKSEMVRREPLNEARKCAEEIVRRWKTEN